MRYKSEIKNLCVYVIDICMYVYIHMQNTVSFHVKFVFTHITACNIKKNKK